MISFQKFLNLKEALSLTDPLAQSTLKITEKNPRKIKFEFILDNDNYKIITIKEIEPIVINHKQLDALYLMIIYLQVNESYKLTNKMGMKANIIYNMLLNAIKQAHDHFGENNIDGYTFSGAEPSQDLMYDRLMKRFAPNLITWSATTTHLAGIYLKPEAIQKIKDKNPDYIEKINNHIHQATSQQELSIQQSKQIKAQNRLSRRQI